MAGFKTRAVMLDLARLMEKQDEYRFYLPWLREWGYNTLHLHLTDDEGSAFIFPRRPELASEGAFSADQMRSFIAEARSQGIQVIPEIESLGHTRFITRHSQYAHLKALPPPGLKGHPWGFNSLIPDHPETRKILGDLLRDTADVFDHDLIHVGLDEVDLSCLRRGRGPDWMPFARHAAWVHEAVRKVGRRPAMWADHVVAAPEMASHFGRDVLMVDWRYDAGVRPDSLDLLTGAGFEVWAAPATVWWRVRLLTNDGARANVREFTAHALRRKRVTGMVNTVWCPYRYLTGAIDWPIAWAGHVFRSKEEDAGFANEFCRSFYGLKGGDAAACAEALTAVYGAAPDATLYDDVLADAKAPHPRFTREHQRRCAERVAVLASGGNRLAALVRRSRRNAGRLNDVVLSVQLLERWARFGAAGLKRSALPPAGRLGKACRECWTSRRVLPPDLARFGYENALRLVE